ncbi:MAG: cytochrome P450 [Chloroflexi bacterium]|nr:cytochrome P450 [Chloroflexota bacterium]
MMTASTRFPLGSKLTLDSLNIDPYPHYRLMLESEPVTWLPEVNLWAVFRRDDVISILDNLDAFTVQSPHSLLDDAFGTMMLSTDGDAHHRLRSPFSEVFLPKIIRASSSAFIEHKANELIDHFIAGREIDLVRSFSDPMALYAVTSALGVTIHDFAQLRGWYDDFAAALSNFRHDPAVRERGQRAAREFGARLSAHLSGLRKEPDDSLLSRILHGQKNDLTDREIISNIFVIIFGGLETTAAMFSNTLWALLHHPDQFEEVKGEPEKWIRPALEESLRWESPVQTATRHVTNPIAVRGVGFAVGDTVQCMLGAANRDPDFFIHPHRFDIHRSNASQHLAFARGKHHCLGASLARLEGEIGLRILFERMPNLHLQSNQPIPPLGHEFRSVPKLMVQW